LQELQERGMGRLSRKVIHESTGICRNKLGQVDACFFDEGQIRRSSGPGGTGWERHGGSKSFVVHNL
jgi:hypothetical protein